MISFYLHKIWILNMKVIREGQLSLQHSELTIKFSTNKFVLRFVLWIHTNEMRSFALNLTYLSLEKAIFPFLNSLHITSITKHCFQVFKLIYFYFNYFSNTGTLQRLNNDQIWQDIESNQVQLIRSRIQYTQQPKNPYCLS